MLDRFPWVAGEAAEADARRFVMVRGLAAYPALAERVSRRDSRISWLPALLKAHPPERVVRASPYFWSNLRQAFAVLSAKGPTDALDQALDRAALAALDSFAGERLGFPEGIFLIPSLAGAQLLRLGLSFDADARIAEAEAQAGAVTLLSDDGRRLRVATPIRSSGSWPVRRIEDAAVDLGRSAHQIEHDESAIEILSPKLQQAMAWIADVSPTVSNLIASEIQYLVPLRSGGASHYSFTLSNLPGLLFIGGSERLLPIVEAIVHETGHARLHHANEVHPLAHGEQREIFYSPWRNDPRPATGVLHGAYVFTLVLAFWIEALTARRGTLNTEDEVYVRSRIALIAIQLREAVEVLSSAPLSPFSQKVLRAIREALPSADALPVSAEDIAVARRTAQAKRSKAAAKFSELILPTE